MKFLKITCFNIIILLLLFIFLEIYFSYKWDIKDFSQYKTYVFNSIPVDKYYEILKKRIVIDTACTKSFRKDENINSSKKPILLMGCSFTYGDGLKEEETVSHKMAKLVNRPIINRAGRGWGLSWLLYLLNKNDFYSNFTQTPEKLIYIYIRPFKQT